MTTTCMVAGIVGVVVAPTFLARAFATPDAHKAATFGLLAAACFLGAVALICLIVRVEVKR